MQKQQGAALIIVLVLLSVSLVIGMSGMSAALVDERLAGNYRATAEAQMASEYAIAEILSQQESDGWNQALWDDSEKYVLKNVTWDELLSGREPEINNCKSDEYTLYRVSCHSELIKLDSETEGADSEFAALGIGAVFNNEGVKITESPPVAIIFSVISSTGSGGDSQNQGLPSNLAQQMAPLVCVGNESQCLWSQSGLPQNIRDYLDGRDHALLPNFDCNGASCRQDPIDPSQQATDVEYIGGDEWNIYIEGLKALDQGTALSNMTRSDPQVLHIQSGDSVSSTGNINTSGIIIVSNGATFTSTGTGHHEGLIIVEEGGRIDLGQNYNVYGSIITVGNVTFDGGKTGAGQGGQGRVRYSQNALDLIPGFTGESSGDLQIDRLEWL